MRTTLVYIEPSVMPQWRLRCQAMLPSPSDNNQCKGVRDRVLRRFGKSRAAGVLPRGRAAADLRGCGRSSASEGGKEKPTVAEEVRPWASYRNNVRWRKRTSVPKPID